MRITEKGQVTIPKEFREKLGLLPDTEVDFILDGNALRVVKSEHPSGRGRRIVEHLRKAKSNTMSTEAIMKLTRN